MIVAASTTSARCRSTTLSKSARCSVRECFAVIYKPEGRRLTLSDVDRQACHLNVLLTILSSPPLRPNRSNWVRPADPYVFRHFSPLFFARVTQFRVVFWMIRVEDCCVYAGRRSRGNFGSGGKI